MAEDEGFEPPQTESESGVLPLHKSSIAMGMFYYTHYFGNVKKFFQNTNIFHTSQGKGFPGSTWLLI